MTPGFIEVYQGTMALGDTSPAGSQRFAATLGLVGEAGEVADLLKKSIYRDQPLDHAKTVEELGDVLWYLARLASMEGISLEDLAFANWAKLHARHPTLYPDPLIVFQILGSPAGSTDRPLPPPLEVQISGVDTSGTSSTPENRAVSAPQPLADTSSPRLPEWVSLSLAYEPVAPAPRFPAGGGN